MNGTETDSRSAGEEARRDVISRAGQTGTGAHYDALLRYLRGLYVRSPKTTTQQTRQAEQARQTPGQPEKQPPPSEPTS